MSATQALKHVSLSRLGDYQLGEKLAELSSPCMVNVLCSTWMPERLKQVKHLRTLSWDLLCIISLLVNRRRRQNKPSWSLWAVSWTWASSEPWHQRQPTASSAVLIGKGLFPFTQRLLNSFWYTLFRRDSRINWSEFSGGNQHAQGAGALALRGEAEGAGLVQPGAEMALGEPDSSLVAPAWKFLRR